MLISAVENQICVLLTDDELAGECVLRSKLSGLDPFFDSSMFLRMPKWESGSLNKSLIAYYHSLLFE